MAFFSKASVALEVDTQAPYIEPIWTGPSNQIVGAIVPLAQVATPRQRVAVVAHYAQCFPNGYFIVVEVRANLKSSSPLIIKGPVMPWESDVPDALRIGFEMSNGRAAGERANHPLDVPRGEFGMPEIPVILPHLRALHSASCLIEAWCAPLPPPGPLRVYLKWPASEIAEETSLTLDGDVIREAGEGAKRLWTP
jgi:hypothetical protein